MARHTGRDSVETRELEWSETSTTVAVDRSDGAERTSGSYRTGADLDDRGSIGEGGMASVRRGFDPSVGREAAVKILKRTASPSAAARFRCEAQITGQLDHPNIVPVYGVGANEDGETDLFTMKLVEGMSIADRLDAYEVGPLPGEVLESMLQALLRVCDAIAFAHSRGVVHRDLKPENIMMGQFGQVYVMDWGIALVKDPDQLAVTRPYVPRPGTMIGTPAYMAPEQTTGNDDSIDERTDVYGLGGILYEILTLRAPHEASTVSDTLELAHRGQVVPPEKEVPDWELPAVLCDIAMKALSARPDDRYQTVEALRLAIQTFLYTGGWFSRSSYRSGEVIVREGEPGSCAYIVERGRIEVYRESDGERRLLRTQGQGEAFGELALFHAGTRTATVVAATDVTLKVISAPTLARELPEGSWLRTVVDGLARRFIQDQQD